MPTPTLFEPLECFFNRLEFLAQFPPNQDRPKRAAAVGAAANCCSGSTISHEIAPRKQTTPATANDIPQPKRIAIHGVREAVTAPPIWQPIFMTPDTDPAERPPMSQLTDQNELCER